MLWRKFHRKGALWHWWHYVLPPQGRFPDIYRRVDQGGDLVVTGARGAGKTTLFSSLARELTSTGRYMALCVYCSQDWKDPDSAVHELRRRILAAGRSLPESFRPSRALPASQRRPLRGLLTGWSRSCDGRAILFLDDFDQVGEEARAKILHQVLCGTAGPGDVPLHCAAVLGAGGFSVDLAREVENAARGEAQLPGERLVPQRLHLSGFDQNQVGLLYNLHRARTGQEFTESAKRAAYRLTKGDPRKVNAVAAEALRRVARRKAVDAGDIEEAYEHLWPRPSLPTWTPSGRSGPASRPHGGDLPGRRSVREPERTEGAKPASSQSQVHPAFLMAAALVLLVNSAVVILRRELSPDRVPPPSSSTRAMKIAKIKKIETVESFTELCGDMGESEEKFDTCRKKLPVFAKVPAWIDTEMLLKDGEALTIDHLGLLYGVSEPQDRATRLALAAVLAAECRRGALTGPASFETLFVEGCRKRLPTLAQLGIDLEESWPSGGERQQ